MASKKMVKGDVFKTNAFGDVELCSDIKNRKVLIKFKDTGTLITCHTDNVRTGKLRDPNSKTLFSVGFLGVGNYSATNARKAYIVWHNMLDRCYNESLRHKNPTYKDCTVVEDWHNFQNFAEWYINNYPKGKEGYHLDKDIKVKGNKVYGPHTCKIVSPNKNITIAHAKNYEFMSPSGDLVKVYNLLLFCKERGLCSSHMSKVYRGILKKHKGWGPVLRS